MKTIPLFLALLFSPALLVQALAQADAAAEALLAVDRAHARAAEEGNLDLLFERWASDMLVLGEGTQRVEGSESVKAMVARNREVSGLSITWVPEEAVVAASGEIGYTYGVIVMVPPGEDAVPQKENYLAIWERQPNGEWKVVVGR